jgi:hypothetical protein
LPDNAPAVFDGFEEARQYLADELLAAADDAHAWGESPRSEQLAADLTRAANELLGVAGPTQFLIKVAGFVWSVESCEDAESCELGDDQ